MTQRLIIMGKNNCPYCDLAKRHLDEHNIPFDYIKIDEDMEAYTEFREFGFRSVPQIMMREDDGKLKLKVEGGWDGLKETPIRNLQTMVGRQ